MIVGGESWSFRHCIVTIIMYQNRVLELASECHITFSTTELMTLASESCSRALVEADCLPVLLELIGQSNRSHATLVVVAGIIRVLSNIARVCEREGEECVCVCVCVGGGGGGGGQILATNSLSQLLGGAFVSMSH